jgi:hypothetical protein
MRRLILITAVGIVAACGGAEETGDDAGTGNTSGEDGSGATSGSGGKGGSAGRAGSGSKGGSSGVGDGGEPSAGEGNSAGKSGSSGSGGSAGTMGGKGKSSTLPPGDCALDAPAFCEKFETPHPGGRGGDLDETRFSFARWAHSFQYFWFRVPASTYEDAWMPATFCGEPFEGILPPDDVRVCDGVGVDGVVSGQLNEVFDDQGDFGFQAMRIRQMFDFTDREGRIAWDVDGKINPHHSGHGWWFEVWITEDPQPLPYHEAPTVTAVPRAGVGFALRFGAGNCQHTEDSWGNALEAIVVAKDFEIEHWFDDIGYNMGDDRCFRSFDAKLNHFEIRLTQNRAEFWASDYEDPASFKLRAVQEDLDLSFSRGYVHFQHSHYNASKDGMAGCEEGVDGTCPSPSQTFRWDNVGFDGPVYPTPRGYDVPNANERGPEGGYYFGWYLIEGEALSFTAPSVDLTDALSASFNFNVMMEIGQELQYRFNGGEWHTFVLPPGPQELSTIRSFTLEAPLEELVTGDNEIEVLMPQADTGYEGIGNLDITVEVP